jgi:hypothetical protein
VSLRSGEIEWVGWVAWASIRELDLPVGTGVYEVVYNYDPDGERLQIGEAIKLDKHLKNYLVGDPKLRAVGGRIKANEDVTQLLVHWAETENQHAVKVN